jgi:hypothetical protein
MKPKPALIEVEYDPKLANWTDAIADAYRRHGLQPGQAAVIAKPKQTKIMGIDGGSTPRKF